MSVVRQLQQRELRQTAVQVPAIRLWNNEIKIREFKILIKSPEVVDSIKYLLAERCLNLMQFPKVIVENITRLSRLEVLEIEGSTYLEPFEAQAIIDSCHELKKFTFSPVWRRKSFQWIYIYEKHDIKWGRDFFVVYRRIKDFFHYQRFMDLYNKAPQWALTDSDSEESD